MAIRMVGSQLENGQSSQIPAGMSGSVPPVGPGVTDAPKTVSKEAVRRAVEEINDKLETRRVFNRKLKVRINDDPHRIIVKVVDAATGDTIREIPPERAVKAAKIIDKLMGLLMDEKA